MAHAQKPDSFFRRNGRVHLNRLGRQFSRLLAAEVCASAVVMLDTPCSEVVWRVLATHSTRQFPLHFPSLRHRVPSHFSWTLTANTEHTLILCDLPITTNQLQLQFYWRHLSSYCLSRVVTIISYLDQVTEPEPPACFFALHLTLLRSR